MMHTKHLIQTAGTTVKNTFTFCSTTYAAQNQATSRIGYKQA